MFCTEYATIIKYGSISRSGNVRLPLRLRGRTCVAGRLLFAQLRQPAPNRQAFCRRWRTLSVCRLRRPTINKTLDRPSCLPFCPVKSETEYSVSLVSLFLFRQIVVLHTQRRFLQILLSRRLDGFCFVLYFFGTQFHCA